MTCSVSRVHMQTWVVDVNNAVTVVRLTVPKADGELAADALWIAGATAVSEEAADDLVKLTADVTDVELIARRHEVTKGRWRLDNQGHDEAADLDAWRAFAKPEPAGDRFLLVPSWLIGPTDIEDPDVEGSGRLEQILIDPGRTFGSGSHPTTRSCVAALEQTVCAGGTVADLGCGSGVLTVVAARLGANRVVAVDIDPAAVDATLENARRNKILTAIDASTTPIDAVVGPFDVVVANIGIRVLVSQADAIRGLVTNGGYLILAGILDNQVAETVDAYPGFTEVMRQSEEGWTVITLCSRI